MDKEIQTQFFNICHFISRSLFVKLNRLQVSAKTDVCEIVLTSCMKCSTKCSLTAYWVLATKGIKICIICVLTVDMRESSVAPP